MERKELHTKYVHLVLEDGILIAVYEKDLNITRAIAEDCIASRLSLTKGKNYPALADITQIAGTRKDARVYLSSDEAIEGVAAGALLVNSAFSTFIGNFFLKVAFSSPIPTRLFSNKASAIKWLQQFREN